MVIGGGLCPSASLYTRKRSWCDNYQAIFFQSLHGDFIVVDD